MNLEDITNNIKEKLGDEATAKIADEVANIIVFNDANKKILQEKDSEISKLKEDKETLIQANGNLLLQVPRGKEEIKTEDDDSDKKPFDFRTLFDDNGRFKR